MIVFYSNFAVAYVNDSETGYLPFPASTFFWYLPPIIFGAVIGLRWSDWSDTWKKWRWWFVGIAIAGLAYYLFMEIHMEAGGTESRLYNLSLIAYATGIGLLLLGLSRTAAGWRKIGTTIAAFGNRSLGIFVIHPVVLLFATQSQFSKLFNFTPLPYLWLWLIAVLVSWVMVEIAYVLRLGHFLFWR